MHDSLNRKEELSGPVLYLRSPSLFHAILCLSQSLISGLPCPSAAREHPTYRFSGRLRLLCPCNDKVHVKTVNGESNPNPQNSLNSKTTSMHQAVRHGRVHYGETELFLSLLSAYSGGKYIYYSTVLAYNFEVFVLYLSISVLCHFNTIQRQI